MNLEGTFFAIIPPLVAIILGLLTKKVNISLIIGIILGVLFYTGFNPISGVSEMFRLIMKVVGSNIGVVIFLILLGMLVYLMNKSGASARYASWAMHKLKSKRQTLFATFFLGIIIFVDDYFNCLTVGTVMRPITDKKKISREKLAYIIDTTAAPICMIAPVSSWAAAVASSIPEGSSLNGFTLFVNSITSNYYSILSIIMVILVIALNLDFGKMKRFECDPTLTLDDFNDDDTTELELNPNVRVIDIVLPVLFLIFSCVMSMLYTGGLFEGRSLMDAFLNSEAILSLCMGTFITILFTLVLYVPRHVISFNDFMEGLPEGFKHMVPSIIILGLAWALGSVCGADYLNAGAYLESLVSKYHVAFGIMPLVFFILAAFFAFSTGTSWGTFVILIPICVNLFGDVESELMILTFAAILGGAVCGDHLSPISDTTILSSTGAGCNHINHVQSQFLYGLFVALNSCVGYIIAGFMENKYLGLSISIALMVLSLVAIKLYYYYKEKSVINS